ncbi:MAG: NADH-quinone oxidoreductase subunit C [Chitinophagaceae bacterium]|jgi:NADH-quinone oxidoreductase subunit C|nr:NADH-quinone oxidoreductase subunit C [Chitinophagaceae bacterium]MBP6045987.1 NADH-quinone oxidoreductase subunit C [Ferruginibacter sp.]MBK7087529.1 NADH-quinone oxidoreductase subunit C [Chitinophagaceae bacterium]MBK7346311.1 NADH-quinone oxidoreductase subunit C [Chitinophagaceae bacterium]MBK7735825.1 NADH-quinone oxidoreductase subunit C [Chitinophagaceae bacterium]
MTNERIQQRLTEKFGELLSNWEQSYGMLSFTAPKEINLKVLQFLYDDEELRFRFLTDLQAVHFPDNAGSELAVVYHLHNMIDNVRLRFRVFASIQDPKVYSATAMYAGANWMERETYDFFGVEFVGHPNLIRVLNVDEMDYFPLRKEYPVEDQTRSDKDDEMFGRGNYKG